jgi:hypothetical protein
MAAWEHVAALRSLSNPLIQSQPLGHSLALGNTRADLGNQPPPWSRPDQSTTSCSTWTGHQTTGPRSKPTDQATHKTPTA